MSRYLDDRRARFGVEPVCQVLGWNPSTYWSRRSRPASSRQRRDELLLQEIRRVHTGNRGVYGARKVWKQLRREGIEVARCTVERLMRTDGLRGVRRGQPRRTTMADATAARPADLVDRRFIAQRPDQLWVADITYVRTWSGFCHVALVIDVYSRLIAGWALATHLRTELPLEALEMALWRRRRRPQGLIHHSDAGSQYTSIRYTERLAASDIEPSVGSRGDSYDNALAESIIGLYKTECIQPNKPWKTSEEVEIATLEWIDWWNQRRLLSSIGDIPPAELEHAYYTSLEGADVS